MKSNNKKVLLTASISSCLLISAVTPIIITSCSAKNIDYFNTTLRGQKYVDADLYAQQTGTTSSFNQYSRQMAKQYSQDWYNTLTSADWNINPTTNEPENLHCSSEKQALALYCNAWGDFWNVELHEGKTPTTKNNKMDGQVFPGKTLEIRGTDYQYISNALSRSSLPENTITYHGVEFMENEFYTQLGLDKQTNVDFSKCVGKTIQSYGFISTTIKKSHAVNWSAGYNWIEDKDEPPFKEPFVFKIYIPKNIKGTAFVSWFDFVGTENYEDQILIDRNSKYEIVNYYKEGKTNFFDLLYLGVENSN